MNCAEKRKACLKRAREEKRPFEEMVTAQLKMPANQREETFQKAFSGLNARHAQLLEMCCAGAGAPVKYAVIGEKFGFTPSRALQIRQIAMCRLQRFHTGHGTSSRSDISVLERGLPPGVNSRLLQKGIYTVEQLRSCSFYNLLRVCGIGEAYAREIADRLEQQGDQLKGERASVT